MATYAVIREDEIVFDIIEFDILSGEQLPYMEVSIIKVGEPTPTAIPTIGQKWDGEINQFVNP
jgi:hypothetical protein